MLFGVSTEHLRRCVGASEPVFIIATSSNPILRKVKFSAQRRAHAIDWRYHIFWSHLSFELSRLGRREAVKHGMMFVAFRLLYFYTLADWANDLGRFSACSSERDI